MENIVLDMWIDVRNGLKVRLSSKKLNNSDEKYILIMEINENGNSRNISITCLRSWKPSLYCYGL